MDLTLLQSVLARPLNEIPDLPKYEVPPPGVLRFLVQKIGTKTINDKPVLAFDFIQTKVVSMGDPNATPLADGALFGESFFFGDQESVDKTLSVLKAKFGACAAQLGNENMDLLELIGKLEGMELQGTIKNRTDKNDATKVYPSVHDCMIATDAVQ